MPLWFGFVLPLKKEKPMNWLVEMEKSWLGTKKFRLIWLLVKLWECKTQHHSFLWRQTTLSWEFVVLSWFLIKKCYNQNRYPPQNTTISVAIDDEVRYFIGYGLLTNLQSYGLNLVNGKQFIINQRMQKTQHELDILDCANRATKQFVFQNYFCFFFSIF